MKSSRRGCFLYILLLLCRILLALFLPGYVHPDEFFQGGQELWFGCPPATPWEFQPHHALRSILPPTIVTWLPLRVYALLGRSKLGGLEILLIPRMWCAILSIVTVDLSVWSITSPCTTKPVPVAVLIVASSWTTLALLARPFSNALETMLLALLMRVTMNQRYTTDLLAGILCALGLFTRFTFVFVAFPLMLRYLVELWTKRGLSQALGGLGLLAFGFLAAAATVLYVDVSYYKGDDWWKFVTPWNALRYNSSVDNLQEHGLHPRWTHALVNMFLLYGPLAVMFYTLLARRLLSLFHDKSKARSETAAEARIQDTCMWTVVSGLGFLSLAPHQEPRFLLPLIAPLAILCGSCFKSWVRCIWILFNAICLIVFGILHQGGVIPSLLDHVGGEPQAVLYYHTYMPPTFVSRKHNAVCSADTCEYPGCANSPIIDLKGSSAETLLSALSEELKCHDEKSSSYVHLVSPPLSLGQVAIGSDCSLGDSYVCQRLKSYRPHLTTEDFPPFDGSIADTLSSFELSVYNVSCRERLR